MPGSCNSTSLEMGVCGCSICLSSTASHPYSSVIVRKLGFFLFYGKNKTCTEFAECRKSMSKGIHFVKIYLVGMSPDPGPSKSD